MVSSLSLPRAVAVFFSDSSRGAFRARSRFPFISFRPEIRNKIYTYADLMEARSRTRSILRFILFSLRFSGLLYLFGRTEIRTSTEEFCSHTRVLIRDANAP